VPPLLRTLTVEGALDATGWDGDLQRPLPPTGLLVLSDEMTTDGEDVPLTSAPPPTTLDTALIDDFSDTARALFAADSVEATLMQVADLAVATIEGCDFAGIFTVDDGQVVTPVHTDPVVVQADALQHGSGEGPCLDAIQYALPFYANDLANDSQWPVFGPLAATIGMRSLLALPLLDEGTLGALNLYARYPDAFGVIDRARGVLLASLAALAFSSAVHHEDEARRADDLQAALATREMIGQAQGILMERERITSDEAFDILRRASQHLNLKLREVAQGLVDTGERPDTGPRQLP
jgi:hypothetical protein